MIIDERKKTYAAMSIGQYFEGSDGKLYKKLSMDADSKNCWNMTDEAYQQADVASPEVFTTVNVDTHILV